LTLSGGIQQWTVPSTGNYTLTAAGAAGGASMNGYASGKGVIVSTTTPLTKGDILYILVGQQGGVGTSTANGINASGGGGGGTFIVKYLGGPTSSFSSYQIILIAGGGGGGGGISIGMNALESTTGGVDINGWAPPVMNGLGGGNYTLNPNANSGCQEISAGSGFYGNAQLNNGVNSINPPALSFLNGGLGGTNAPNNANGNDGGFGGGGGSSVNGSWGTGGGGGYSGGSGGGGSGLNWVWVCTGGGGGGSYDINGVNNNATKTGYNSGTGYATISTTNNPSTLSSPVVSITSINGLQLWLDGQDPLNTGSAPSNGTSLSTWYDKSGNANNLTQSTTGYQPQYSSGVVQLGAVSGAQRWMYIPPTVLNATNAYSIFLVLTTTSSNNWIITRQHDYISTTNGLSTSVYLNNGGKTTGTTNSLYWYTTTGNPTIPSVAVAPSIYTNSGNTILPSTTYLASIIYDGTTLFMYINGTLVNSSIGNYNLINEGPSVMDINGNPTQFSYALGGFKSGATFLTAGTPDTQFTLSSLAVYNTNLHAGDRQMVEYLLGSKYGVISSYFTRIPGTLNTGTVSVWATGFNAPIDVDVDFVGNVYVSDLGNQRIVKITPNQSTSVYSTGYSNPQGVLISKWSNIVYICDTNNNRIQQISLSTGTTSNYSGWVSGGYINFMVMDNSGNLYANDANTGSIYSINRLTGAPTAYVSNQFQNGNNGGMVCDLNGAIYVVCPGTHCIYKVVNGSVSLFAGIPGSSGFTNGPTLSATFNNPQAITIDTYGNLYVPEHSNNCIRKITQAGIVSTFVTGLNGPSGICIDQNNVMYVANRAENNIIRIV
jgi:sugar lactone lactonase YvrE